MREVYRQFLKALSRDEAVEVRDVLKVRKGFDRMGAQRWQCTACRRTFGLKACCMRSKTAPFGGSDCDAA